MSRYIIMENDKQKLEAVIDPYNNRKVWIIKQYKASGNYYLNQCVGGHMLNKRFTRVKGASIENILDIKLKDEYRPVKTIKTPSMTFDDYMKRF
jgi:hypothetical protein